MRISAFTGSLPGTAPPYPDLPTIGMPLIRRGSWCWLDNFRPREFAWAVAAAGLPETTTPYTLRHSGLSWALAAGIPATDVARYGGTSLAMLERTYHHLLVSSAESARARMDEFMAATVAAAGD